jgi:hypothetical protein
LGLLGILAGQGHNGGWPFVGISELVRLSSVTYSGGGRTKSFGAVAMTPRASATALSRSSVAC